MLQIQPTLDLPHTCSYAASDFLRGSSNLEALTWLERWPDWPTYAVILTGSPGCGKTHMGRMFAAKAGAAYMEYGAASLAAPDQLVQRHNCIVLDNIAAPLPDAALLHTLNLLQQAGKTMLMIARDVPGTWGLTLPDVLSRLHALPLLRIEAPDDILMTNLLAKLFQDRQLRVEPVVIDYIVRHATRSMSFVQQLVTDLDAASLSLRRPVTIPLVRSILERHSIDHVY